MSFSSYDVPIHLSLAADRRLRMFELADAVVLSHSGLTRLVGRLERGGLVERERGEVDPRQIYARLIDRGVEVLADATPTPIAGIKERFLKRLGRGDEAAGRDLAGGTRAVSAVLYLGSYERAELRRALSANGEETE